MRRLTLAHAVLLGMTSLSALAQTSAGTDPATGARPGHEPGIGDSLPRSDRASNIGPGGSSMAVAPTLPGSGIGLHASTAEYLQAARTALASGHTGKAQQSLEMAETRALDRSVDPAMTNTPSDSRLVAQIRDARHALGSGNRKQAMQLIDQALAPS